MQEILLEIRYFERGLSKSLTRINFIFFLSNSVPFKGQSYWKQKGPGTSGQSLFMLENKLRKIPLLVKYYLAKFDAIIESSFWVIPKITSGNLCKPIHDIINNSMSICPIESGKWKGREKITKNWISWERKELLRWNKKHYS